MNVNDVITKLKVMLGAEEVVEAKFAEATLVDGTEVFTEGELEVGAILFVRAGEGEDNPFAPAGKHETTDGQIITVGENGEISQIDNADEDSVEEEAEVAVELEEEVKVEEEVEKVFNAEELIAAIAEMLMPQAEVIEELKKELSVLTERFETVANQPAAKKVTTNTFKEIMEDKNAKMASKLEMLRQLKNNK